MADSVPAPMVPTTEGSVILAGWGEGTHPCHWMHNGNSWTAFDGAVMRATDLTVVRVLFDAGAVPAPMVQVPAETVEKLWEAYNHRTAFAANVIAAARAVLNAATPAASVPAADILALAKEFQDEADERNRATGDKRNCYEKWDAAQRLRTLVADSPRTGGTCNQCGHAHGAYGCGDCRECRAPAAPVDEPLPEGWHHIPWTSKEDGVGAPETPASGESGPPAPPALCVGCGHDIGLHNEKGCLHGWAGPEGLCRCRLDGSQAPRVPVNDEAEAAWQAYKAHPVPDDYRANRKSFLAGFRAARQEDA